MTLELPLAETGWMNLLVTDVARAGIHPSLGARPDALEYKRLTNGFEFTGAFAKVMS
ncbi:hypothetical protein [Caballeronia mineralivorans]|jgi:hypothetical protein|uniref:hypothetical protein n=1 Tax=Caballeronia mineralivorans TaxID=2010198 RepID=UPI0023EFC296|nr:hypothetical protein [Caballeronia mineralivorans]